MQQPKDVCDIYCYDEHKVNRVKDRLAQAGTGGAVQMFKALADETRLKIVHALCVEHELCVCDVANIIGATIANASHHLRALKQMGLAKHRKEGKLVFYSLDDPRAEQIVMLAISRGKERCEYAEQC
jgi:DNA-binding transcriptional ArsR family regulator